MKNNCLVYAVVVSLLVVAILFIVLNDSSSSENYACFRDQLRDRSMDMPVVSSGIDFVPVADFATRRQSYFNQPDNGQYSYAGCRCSRVGTQMNNGTTNSQLYN